MTYEPLFTQTYDGFKEATLLRPYATYRRHRMRWLVEMNVPGESALPKSPATSFGVFMECVPVRAFWWQGNARKLVDDLNGVLS